MVNYVIIKFYGNMKPRSGEINSRRVKPYENI